MFEACIIEELVMDQTEADVGYDYTISSDNYNACADEEFNFATESQCVKFSSDHPDYFFSATVNDNNYPTGCYLTASIS